MPDQPSDEPRAATRAELRSQRGEVEPAVPRELSVDDLFAGALIAPAEARGDLVEDDAAWDDAAARVPRPPHVPRTDWRLGGRTVVRWREWLLAVAFVSLGLGILIGTLITFVWASPWAPAAATAVIWLGMLAPIVWAFTRSRPAGLLRFRALDLLYGLVLGAIVRVTQGAIDAASGASEFPSYPLVDGSLPTGWLVTDGVGAALIAPTIEELFFRGVVLVALYTVLRRPLGKTYAGLVGLLVSTGLFVLAHGMTGGVSLGTVVAIALLSLVCGLLVLLTGRIWGAVLTHVTFNTTWVILALAGTFLT